MARTKSKEVYELVKSLDKNEKRYFKIMFSGSSQTEDRKMLMLFDLLNTQKEYDESAFPKKIPTLKIAQISNLKAYLHEKILQSLRQYHLSKIPDIKIREQIDFAQLLVERRQYTLALSCFKKAKKMAIQYNKLELQLEILQLEKELIFQTDQTEASVDELIAQVRELNSRINNINIFSNLSAKLNSFYRKIGFIREEAEYLKVKEFFYSNLPEYKETQLSDTEKMYLYRLFTAYYFFVQDFDQGYYCARKLEAVFDKNQGLLKSHPEIFLTSLNIVLNAEFKLNKYQEFLDSNKKLENAQKLLAENLNENLRIRMLKYAYLHQINKFFMQGSFDKGVTFIKENAVPIASLSKNLDVHSYMILSYKIACIYFGASAYGNCIQWLHKIINISKEDMREDLLCFARIMNLICHFELGNFDVIGYYIINTYRFLLKKDDLHLFQKFILTFLKTLRLEQEPELVAKFKKLKNQLLPLLDNPFEKRAFIYFDIISYLESKIEKKSVQEIIQTKFKNALHV